MSEEEIFHGSFVYSKGDTIQFTQDEVARALQFVVSEPEAAQAAAEMYAVDPATSGIWFDEHIYSALERVSQELAERVPRVLNESPKATGERRARFEKMLQTGKCDCCE